MAKVDRRPSWRRVLYRRLAATPLGRVARRGLHKTRFYERARTTRRPGQTRSDPVLTPGVEGEFPRLRQRPFADAASHVAIPEVPPGRKLGWKLRRRDAGESIRYDIDLFEELNKEYESKPLVPQPRNLGNQADKVDAATQRLSRVARFIDLHGTDALEIGCGQGQEVWVLGNRFDCHAHGIDVTPYAHWTVFRGPRATFQVADATHMPFADDSFDRVISFAVWEHLMHPYTALAESVRVLRPGGLIYLYANLHRGPSASHRYRQVFFPWPHLLFEDKVVEEFYERRGLAPMRNSWVNRCTGEHYIKYFNLLKLEVLHLQYTERPWDQSFYERFTDVLGRYPIADLKRDFILTVLRKPAEPA